MCVRCYNRCPGAPITAAALMPKPYVRGLLLAGKPTGRGGREACSRGHDSRAAGMSALSLYALCPVFVHNPPALNRRCAHRLGASRISLCSSSACVYRSQRPSGETAIPAAPNSTGVCFRSITRRVE